MGRQFSVLLLQEFLRRFDSDRTKTRCCSWGKAHTLARTRKPEGSTQLSGGVLLGFWFSVILFFAKKALPVPTSCFSQKQSLVWQTTESSGLGWRLNQGLSAWHYGQFRLDTSLLLRIVLAIVRCLTVSVTFIHEIWVTIPTSMRHSMANKTAWGRGETKPSPLNTCCVRIYDIWRWAKGQSLNCPRTVHWSRGDKTFSQYLFNQ